MLQLFILSMFQLAVIVTAVQCALFILPAVRCDIFHSIGAILAVYPYWHYQRLI